MIRTFYYTVDAAENGQSIQDYLKQKGYSRNILIHLKKTPNSILVNSVWEHVTYPLHTGDQLTISLVEEESSQQIVPVHIPFSIVYEDADILLINKAANTPIHPSINNFDNTLANGVLWYYSKQQIPFVFRCVNRLDRDTTGLTLIAKNMLSSHLLSAQIRERKVHREYAAIVQGDIPDSGTIDAPIGRLEDSVIMRCVRPDGERAITHYRKLAYNNGLSLVSLHLETGRTHQIRVHMTSIGHPLIGDFLYNPDNRQMNRQALHSRRLTFTHPITGEFMDFTTPLPADMAAYFDS